MVEERASRVESAGVSAEERDRSLESGDQGSTGFAGGTGGGSIEDVRESARDGESVRRWPTSGVDPSLEGERGFGTDCSGIGFMSWDKGAAVTARFCIGIECLSGSGVVYSA